MTVRCKHLGRPEKQLWYLIYTTMSTSLNYQWTPLRQFRYHFNTGCRAIYRETVGERAINRGTILCRTNSRLRNHTNIQR